MLFELLDGTSMDLQKYSLENLSANELNKIRFFKDLRINFLQFGSASKVCFMFCKY